MEETVLAYVQVGLGLALLFGGGELLIRGAVALARRLAVSPLLVGATVVAFGTSAPELAVTVQASWKGHAALAVGNVLGSNIANVLLILGIAALVSPVLWQPIAMRRDALLLAFSTILFVIFLGSSQRLTAWEGALMVGVLIGVTCLFYWYERQNPPVSVELLEREAAQLGPPPGFGLAGATTAAGLAGVVLGSDQLVEGATHLALAWGISEATIGLTLVAVGTSLPELATAVVAAYRNHADVALGNVVGSCTFNSLGVAGTAALLAPLAIPPELLDLDLWLMLAVLLLLSAALRARARLGRRAGLACLALYAVWIATKA